MSDVDLAPVELGYAEEIEDAAARLQSHFFVSKIGGKPCWLSFKPLPLVDSLRCGVCSTPMAFLLQVYAPLSERESTFHRVLFVFVCRNPACSVPNESKNLVVLRCQLPRKNEFYSYDALDDVEDAEKSENIKDVKMYSKVCIVCGCLGDKQCSQCKLVTYCDKSHQLLHWKLAHRQECKENTSPVPFENTFLFPEYELVTEVEEYVEEEKKKKERSEQERMKDYEEFLKASNSELGGETTKLKINDKDEHLDELEMDMAKKKDKVFKRFQRRIAQNPEQVLRYQRLGEPLWASKNWIPCEDDIPHCPLCGSRRVFEFQVMPHLLSYLDVDALGQSIDWGTLVVYTCENSCDIDDNDYTTEVVIKQDFSE